MKAAPSGRVFVRLLVMVLALVGTGIGATAAAQAATAAACATPAHVYVNGGHFKWEFDPLDGPIDTVTVPFGGTITYGGNGIEPGEDPFWNIHRESDGAYIATNIGNRTHSNCVSNEKTFIANLDPGSYIIYAFYYKGDGTPISAQKHFREVVTAP